MPEADTQDLQKNDKPEPKAPVAPSPSVQTAGNKKANSKPAEKSALSPSLPLSEFLSGLQGASPGMKSLFTRRCHQQGVLLATAADWQERFNQFAHTPIKE